MGAYEIERAKGPGSPGYETWDAGNVACGNWITIDTPDGDIYRIRFHESGTPPATAPIAAESVALKRISHTVGDRTITVETTGSVALLAELLALAMKEVP